jgi:Zn-dependent protease
MIAVYTTIYGWQFAVGLVISIYIHEMGHVVWLRRFGIPATAPMFIPGFGAFVRLKAHPATAGEDARVGLAGPVWGAGAALIALALGFATGHRALFGIAYFGAVINVFNLLPVWQLDGGRAFVALSRRQRAIAAGVLWVAGFVAGNPTYFLVAIAATFRAASAQGAPAEGDRNILLTYAGLVAGLAAIMLSAGKI